MWSCLGFSTPRRKLTHLWSPFVKCVFPGLRSYSPSLMPTKADCWSRSLTERVQQTGPWNWRDWQLYLRAEDKGVAKPTFKSKVKEMSKLPSTVPTLFSAKVYEPCTANLSYHEPPTPALFSLRHQCPALTQPAVSSIIKSLYRTGFPPLDSQATSSFVGHVNWSFWAERHGWYLFHMWLAAFEGL